MGKSRFRVAVNGDINYVANRQVIHDDIPEMLGSLGDKFYFHMPMGWRIDDSMSTPPMGTVRIYNRGSRLEGCYRGALLLTTEVAVFLCSTHDSRCLAFVRNGRAVVVPESIDGFFGAVPCSKDGMKTIKELREYFKVSAFSWQALEEEYPNYKWDDIKPDITHLLLVGGVA